MRVLYFHQHFSRPSGAAGTRSFEMARALIERGHSVTMVCGSYNQGDTGLKIPFAKGRRRGLVDGIDVIEFQLAYGNQLGFWKRVAVFAKFAIGSVDVAMREPADVIFATTTPLTAGIPGIFARWLRCKPFVFEVRDLWPELPKAIGAIKNPIILALMSALEWVSYRSADRLIGLSPGIVDGILARGVKRDRVIMVPNGCDLEIFGADAPGWRPEGVAPESMMAIFTGTHGQANGLDAVLDAAAVLKKRGENRISLVLVGQGREKPRLQQRAQQEGLEMVKFVDPVAKTQLAGLMAEADLGMQLLRNVPAFYFGTSPNKFFDYLSASLPVLNNYPGWVGEMVAANECGFVVPPDEPEAFADALIAAANDREALEKMGKNAKALAESEFSRTRLSEEWVDWVQGAAAR